MPTVTRRLLSSLAPASGGCSLACRNCRTTRSGRAWAVGRREAGDPVELSCAGGGSRLRPGSGRQPRAGATDATAHPSMQGGGLSCTANLSTRTVLGILHLCTFAEGRCAGVHNRARSAFAQCPAPRHPVSILHHSPCSGALRCLGRCVARHLLCRRVHRGRASDGPLRSSPARTCRIEQRFGSLRARLCDIPRVPLRWSALEVLRGLTQWWARRWRAARTSKRWSRARRCSRWPLRGCRRRRRCGVESSVLVSRGRGSSCPGRAARPGARQPGGRTPVPLAAVAPRVVVELRSGGSSCCS